MVCGFQSYRFEQQRKVFKSLVKMSNERASEKHPITDLVNRILAKLGQTVTGKTLGRVAVEVGEVEDVKRLVEAGTVNWNETVQGEDQAIMWALINDKSDLVQLLLEVPGVNLAIKDTEGWSLTTRAISKGYLGKLL